MRVTRRYAFAASHRLHAPELSSSQNSELYGKCNNPFGHGHDYSLEISVVGPVDTRTGLVVPVPALDELVRREVLAAFDHVNLNTEVAEFAQLIPTSENILRVIEQRLNGKWTTAFPHSSARIQNVRIQETARNSFALQS